MTSSIFFSAHAVLLRGEDERARRAVGGGLHRAAARQLVHLGALILPDAQPQLRRRRGPHRERPLEAAERRARGTRTKSEFGYVTSKRLDD